MAQTEEKYMQILFSFFFTYHFFKTLIYHNLLVSVGFHFDPV